MLKECNICGVEEEDYYMYQVEGKNHWLYNVCASCYNKKMNEADLILILQAKVEGIIECLSEVQKNQVQNVVYRILEKQIFADIGENKEGELK